MKYAKFNLGQIEAIINMVGGVEGAEQLLRGEMHLVKGPKMVQDKEGVVTLSLVSYGEDDWPQGFGFRDGARDLFDGEFIPTFGEIFDVVILPGSLVSQNEVETFNEDFIERVNAEANKRRLIVPFVEVACLLREKFTDSEIARGMHFRDLIIDGLWIHSDKRYEPSIGSRSKLLRTKVETRHTGFVFIKYQEAPVPSPHVR